MTEITMIARITGMIALMRPRAIPRIILRIETAHATSAENENPVVASKRLVDDAISASILKIF